jgi:hypothetical protein
MIYQNQTHLNSIKELMYQELKSSITFPNILKQWLAYDQKCFKVTLMKFLYHSFYSMDDFMKHIYDAKSVWNNDTNKFCTLLLIYSIYNFDNYYMINL